MSDAFHTTRWSTVLAVKDEWTAGARTALSELCETYWEPLYRYARRRGMGDEEARDLTQAFFAELIEKRWVEAADPVRGRFRAFLLTAFKRYAGHLREKEAAAKRGGEHVRVDYEPTDRETPERAFERQWALTLLARVVEGLRVEMEEEGKADLFRELKPTIGGEGDISSYRDVAGRLDMTEGAVKVAVHRLRRRYRARLRNEIAQTVSSPQEVDEEIRDLLRAC